MHVLIYPRDFPELSVSISNNFLGLVVVAVAAVVLFWTLWWREEETRETDVRE